MPSQTLRRAFFRGLLCGLRLTWPILSVLIALMVALGIVVARLEGWPAFNGIYFAFVSGLTVGYGDLAPKLPLSRVLAIVLGFTGILLTGMVAAISVQALQQAVARPPETEGRDR